ncbi:MAG: LacI family transcriptional regulator, partial [Comamonadaceae bacterium]
YEIAQEEEAVSRLIAASVDGMILVVSSPSTSAALARLQAARSPYVLAYNRHPAHPCVSVDSESASADVVARLVALGHRDIAMVSGTLAASDRSQQRYRGYLKGMAAAGLAAPPLLEVPFVETATDAIRRHLASAQRPTALFCSNDLLAIRSIRAAAQAGLQVPRDLAVVGFDGIALGEDLTPMLSTVSQPNSQIGARSVELLVQALAAGQPLSPEAGVLLPHAFRTGESCGPVSSKAA